MIKGKDIVILNSDGTAAIAAARSCEINATAETLETASPSVGNYHSYEAGRIGWNITINHLVMSLARTLPAIGTSLSIILAIDGESALPFLGFVNNVTIQTGSYAGTPSAIYWDKTLKKFVGYVSPSAGVQLYFDSWTNSEAYTSPSAYDTFKYNNTTYTWLSNDLTAEKLTGTAIVTNAKDSGSVGSLAQGSMTLLGSGAFTPASLT